MLDKPKDYNDIKQWFSYFRLTKYLPGMVGKLKSAMSEVPDNNAARFVMTAYAAAALDVVFYVPMSPPSGLAQDLEFLCGVKPGWLQTLSVAEIAKPMKITAAELAEKLKTGGFEIDASGIIGRYEQPTPAQSGPSRPRAAPRP